MPRILASWSRTLSSSADGERDWIGLFFELDGVFGTILSVRPLNLFSPPAVGSGLATSCSAALAIEAPLMDFQLLVRHLARPQFDGRRVEFVPGRSPR